MTTGTGITDGRYARSARTRQAVVRALLDLIAEGDLRPTARRVAERAGISLRSVYVHFDDLEDLFLAAAHEQTLLVAGLSRAVPSDGPFEVRVAAYAEQRCAVLEAVAPIRRAADLQEPFSPTLARRRAAARRAARDEIDSVFDRELSLYDGRTRRTRLAAIDVLASSAGWSLLRRTNGLSAADARRAVEDAIRALLPERS